MTIDVRPAAAADLPALAALFHEMEVHYDGPAAAPRLGARPWDDVVSLRLDGAALARLAEE